MDTNQNTLIIGLGESGLACARWFQLNQENFKVIDNRAQPERLTQLKQLIPSAIFTSCEFANIAEQLEGITRIVVSPGLSPHHQLTSTFAAAKERNIPIVSEIEIFAQALQKLAKEKNYSPQILAITGTNGKTTVTQLTGHLLKQAGLSVAIAGNVSPSALDALSDALEKDELPQVWVLELSSFQLLTTYSLNADAATVLNITPDHLDWHKDMAEYVIAKMRIFGEKTKAVLNRDDPVLSKASAQIQNAIYFGLNEPKWVGDLGVIEQQDLFWFVEAQTADDGQTRRRKKQNTPEEVTLKQLMPSKALKIRGQHNMSNALAALALCRALGIAWPALLYAVRGYTGEPHRMQFLMNIAHVDYFDDSKGTNVGATQAALGGLAKEYKKIVLIAGGDGKEQDFAPLKVLITEHTRAVCLIGKDAKKIAQAIGDVSKIIFCQTLLEAAEKAAQEAQEGDAVLLSPACASFDMFSNYVHRAQVYKQAVEEIAATRGIVLS